jgi:hypothetical protein
MDPGGLGIARLKSSPTSSVTVCMSKNIDMSNKYERPALEYSYSNRTGRFIGAHRRPITNTGSVTPPLPKTADTRVVLPTSCKVYRRQEF